VLAALPGRARARFRVGRFLQVDGATAVFALPNDVHRSYCDEVRHDVEEVLGAHFGIPVPLRLVVDPESGSGDGTGPAVSGPASSQPATGPRPVTGHAPTTVGTTTEPSPGEGDRRSPGDELPVDDEALLDPAVLQTETELAGAGPTPEQRLRQAFPGAEEI